MGADTAPAASIKSHPYVQRFIALLLIFALASQAALTTPNVAAHTDGSVAADPMDASPMDHDDCAGQTTAGNPPGNPPGNTGCPCCPDAITAAAGCASYCIAALAVLPAGLSFAAELGATYASLTTQPLATRSDIPPTPPPIA